MDSETFARQLAHELRTPLGQIEAIAELLLEQGCSGPQARQWLVRQSQLARQMVDTTACLLDLAHAHRGPLQVEDVDLSGLCERVRSDTSDGPRRAPVQWRIAPGLCVRGCPQQVTVLMRNLLSNAVKYTRDATHPLVSVSRGSDGMGAFVAVQDNGVGFDDAASGRLFQPFVRLHSGQFEGTGLGLSIVRHIVERHGGWIRATGTPQRGARFEFSLGLS